MTNPSKPRIFFSYSHKDRKLREELDAHLAVLKRLEVVEAWHDGMILPGQAWEEEIWRAFEAADLILLLISSDFNNSDFCYSRELARAMKRHEAGTAYVVPVFVRSCFWKGAPYTTLNGLPVDARPVTLWDDRDEAWTNVVEGIAARVSRLELKKPAAQPAPPQASVSMSLVSSTLPPINGHKTFSVDIIASGIPTDGYVGWQTYIDYGSLLYSPPTDLSEFLWPEANLAVALRSYKGSVVALHGVLSGLLPPLPVSHYKGPLLRVRYQCVEDSPDTPHSHTVKLIGLSDSEANGSAFLQPGGPALLHALGQEETDGVSRDIVATVEIPCGSSTPGELAAGASS